MKMHNKLCKNSLPFAFAFIAVAALIVVTMLRSRSSSIELSTAAKPPLQELHAMVGGFRSSGILAA